MDNRVQLARLGSLAGVLLEQAQRFWQWWSQELVGLVPARWRQRLLQRGTLLCVALDDDHCRIGFGSFQQIETVASAQLDAAGEWPAILTDPLLSRAAKADQVVLLLPPGKVLRKVIGLPAATEAGLANVLRFEMDRHTPFASEQVYFGWRILQRDRVSKRLQLELQVVLREYLDGLLQRLAELGVHPGRVSLGEPSGEGALPPEGEAAWRGNPVNLLPGSRRRESRRNWRGDRRLQGGVALVVVALLAIFPLQQQRREAERLDEELSKPRATAERAARVRDELQRLESGRGYLARQQTQATVPLLLLKELTDLLPDSTWLSRFELNGERVRLEGESAEASGLIGLFEKSQLLQNVSFASPITSNPRTQKDRFSLIGELRAVPGQARPAGEGNP